MLPSLDQLTIRLTIDDIFENVANFRDILALLGAFYAAKLCMKTTYTCYRALKIYVLPKIWYQKNFRSMYGEWAVVTGASEGIGRCYSLELAKRGMNIVLISRSYSKLDKVAKEIESNFNVKTKILTADFNDQECSKRIEKDLAGLEIGVLVNNVGIMYDRLQNFLTVSSETKANCQFEYHVNSFDDKDGSTTDGWETRSFPMISRRKKGAIINLSSGACVQPVPYMTAYSAAKIYTDYFSRALNYEYHSDGVIVQSVQPFYVSTRMTNFMKPNVLVPNAESYVDHALKTLSFTSRTYGYWSHALMGFLGSLLPEWLFFWATININVPMWHYMAGITSEPLEKQD